MNQAQTRDGRAAQARATFEPEYTSLAGSAQLSSKSNYIIWLSSKKYMFLAQLGSSQVGTSGRNEKQGSEGDFNLEKNVHLELICFSFRECFDPTQTLFCEPFNNNNIRLFQT